jgi:hypothetical protein
VNANRKGSVAKRWEPVVTPAEQNQQKKAAAAPLSAQKSDVDKRWDPEPSTSSAASATPASEQAQVQTDISKAAVTRGNVVKRWNPAEETKDTSRTVEAPKAGGKVTGRWNVSEGDHAPVSGSRASEIEELRRIKEEQKAKEVGRETGVLTGPSYGDNDEAAIIAHIAQNALKGDKELGSHQFSKDTPMGAELADGIVIGRLFDKLIPGVIDVRAINKTPNETRDKAENWNLVIGHGRSIGCRLHSVQGEACAVGNVSQIQLVLWESIRVSFEQRMKRAKVYLEASFPEDKVADLVKWPIEELLGKWATNFVKSRGLSRKVDDLADLKDGEVLAAIVAAVIPGSSAVAKISDPSERVTAVVEAVNKTDNGTLASKSLITQGVQWQLFIVLSALFLKASTVVW